MTEIFTASTLEEAKQKAAEAFGAAVSEITFQVLEEPKRSLLGGLFGKKEEYRVEATYTAPAAQEPAAEIAADTVETVAEEVAEEISAEPEADSAEDAEVSGRPAVPEEIQLEKMQIGAAYLEQVLAQLAPEVKCTGKLENGISFSLEGNGAGSLIGRRGDPCRNA